MLRKIFVYTMNSDLGKFRVYQYFTLIFKDKLHYFNLIYTDINSIEISTNIILIMHIFVIKKLSMSRLNAYFV